jgi:hypothetical protein
MARQGIDASALLSAGQLQANVSAGARYKRIASLVDIRHGRSHDVHVWIGDPASEHRCRCDNCERLEGVQQNEEGHRCQNSRDSQFHAMAEFMEIAKSVLN